MARDLLTESGSIFVQIGDENVHRVRAVMDEVFGETNFVAHDRVQEDERRQTASRLAQALTDYILWYAKDVEHALKFRQLYSSKSSATDGDGVYSTLRTRTMSARSTQRLD